MLKKLIVLAIMLLGGTPIFAQSVDTAWVRRYNGPKNSADGATAMVLDNYGNIYVTGYSFDSLTDRDYTTIKYDSAGKELWVKRYSGSGSSDDWAWAITVDDYGNVYVTGTSGTVKYDSVGNQLWIGSWGGADIGTDDSSNILVTGTVYLVETGDDYSTVKYFPNGDTAWVRNYDGSSHASDGAQALAVDCFGNVYVTGVSYDSLTGDDYVTIKYYPNGDTAWVRRYNGPVNGYDCAYAIFVDDAGNAYVTGYSQGSGTWLDCATIKYDSGGSELWVTRYNGPGNYADVAYAIDVDYFGNIYITGRSYGSGTDYDYMTLKYCPNGDTAWIRRYNGPGNGFDEASAIAIDDSGNVYVTGKSYDNDPHYTTIKYGPTGKQLWVKRYSGPGNFLDGALDIALDYSSNVYVTGYSYGIGSSGDFATLKYVQFLRGDVNKDGSVTISDVVHLINYLFKSGHGPLPIIQAGDATCDGKVSVSDVVYLISYLFKGGSPPCL